MGNSDRFAPGSRIGDYVVEHEAGDGYEAVHVLLPRRVHLEVMHPTFVGLKPVAVRMMREACILEALRHPGVPRIFEVGMMSDARTTRPWVASELVEGESLAASGVLSPVEVLELIRDLADVLAYTHERGVVHRALRLETIVRSETRGYPICIVDWSDARVDASDRARADDIFAIGVIAYQALTGHLPNMPTARRAPGAPARLCLMIDDLLVANPMSRPSAAEARARAKLILETIDDGEPVIEESIDLDAATELSYEDMINEPTAPQLPSLRTRWTPPHGVNTSPPPLPAAATAMRIGVLKPRS
jgi:serine/threonine protein kinase